MRQTRLPLTSDESRLFWKTQDSFQSTGIKVELLVVSCISNSESPFLQPKATGSQSKTGSRSHLPVRCRLLLPLSVPELLDPCPGCKPAQRNGQKTWCIHHLRGSRPGSPSHGHRKGDFTSPSHRWGPYEGGGRAPVPPSHQISALDPL